MKKNIKYIYIYISPCCTKDINTTYYKITILQKNKLNLPTKKQTNKQTKKTQKTRSWTWRTELYLQAGKGEEVGWTGSLCLVDENYYIWNGYAFVSY